MKKYYFHQQLLTLIFLFISGVSLLAQYKTDTLKNGSGTWKPPVGCDSFYVELWGGGAGGNTSGSATGSLTTGGGGGGSYLKSTTFAVTSGTFTNGYQYVVGAGGNINNNGGDTWFYNTNCLANGGKTRPTAQQKSPLNIYVTTSYIGGGGGSSFRNFFNQYWQGGGGAAGRRSGDGYTGGNADEGFQGGGAEGGAYDNGDATKGQGGKTGAYFPGVPGGGGSGDQNGSTGIIIIFYKCTFNPGGIGFTHTVPTPVEFGPFTDLLANVQAPASFGYRLKWEGSKNNSTWDSLGGTGLASFVQDSIKQNTYYRRTVANGCGTNNSTPPVLIKVFGATTGKNGVIRGRVTSINGTTGVGEVTITAQKTVALKGSPQTFKYVATTNSNGDYTIGDIFYGDRDNGDPSIVSFTLIASRTGHRLSTRIPVELSFNTNTSTGNNFVDSTVFSVTGRVTQSCDPCLGGYKGPFGLANVQISANDLTIQPVTTRTDSLSEASIGYFGLAVSNPGIYTFTPTYLNHKFDPQDLSRTVNADVVNLNFSDTSTRVISGKLTDVAGRRIGKATLLFEGFYKRSETSPRHITFRRQANINLGDSTYSVRLPAGPYNVFVDSFASAFSNTDDRYITEVAVKTFFNNLAMEPVIDISTKDSLRNLVYHRSPVIKVFGFRDTACNTNPAKNPGLVFRTNAPKRFEAYVYEGPESIGDKVKIFNAGSEWGDSLANYLRIYTNVTKRSATANADTLLFRLKNTIPLATPMIDSFLIPGAPNFASPFLKDFQVFYFDRYGRNATFSPLTPIPTKTTVVGVFNPTSTFTTASPEVPFLILHAPPGDGSYSFWEIDSSIQTGSTFKVASQNGVDGFANVSLGPSVSLSPGGPFEGLSFDATVVINANYTHQRQVNSDTLDELITTTNVNQRFQTDRSNVFIEGLSGDVYIGNGINFILGKSITVDFIPLRASGACEIETASRLFMAPDSIRTEFAYSESHIEGIVIPTQLRLAAEATNDSVRLNALSQAKVWRQVIDQNIRNKKDAALIRNRSFSSGVGTSYTETISNSNTNTITYETQVSNNFAVELGLYVAGIGASGGVAITMQQTIGGSKSVSRNKATTIGYFLNDNDPGDYYSVNIKKDPVYSTPVFDLVAGTSSCPPEQGAQNRDQPQIITGDMRFDSLDANTVKDFIMTVTNKSESGETRNYTLSVDQITSAGLIVTTDGYNLKSPIPFTFLLPYDQSLNVPIKVEKSNKTDKKLSYPNVEFYATDNCNLPGLLYPNTISTAKISFNFASACGSINLSAPADGFVVNADNQNILPITMDGYTLNNIDSVTLQYQTKSARSGGNWKTGFTVKRADINNAASFTKLWNVAALADSIYNLRLQLICVNGDLIYSNIIAGVIDRKAPILQGSPQPISGVYIPNNNEIAYTYDEALDNTNLNDGRVALVRRSNNTQVPITVTAINNKLVVIPVNDLGLQSDSFRVIVSNISDRYGNIKTIPDTSFFKLGTAAGPIYTGTNVATVHVVQTSIAENSPDSIAVYFRLRQPATKVTKVYFNVSGTALYGADYQVSYDTIKVKKCNDTTCTNFTLLPVLNDFIGYPGYVNIDSSKTEAILYIHPKPDTVTEPNETITIALVEGGAYKLQDSVRITATILSPTASCPSGNILYVNSNATGNNSGINWLNAMTSLKTALNSSCAGITQIWVAKGTYKPTTNTSRDSSFTMKNNLAIYGGFAGTETALSQRNIRLNPTILSGDIGIANSNADNSYNVVRNISNGLNATAIIDGFIVSGGNADGGGFGGYGAGIINVNSTASFYNCSIIGNNAANYGGGMYNNGTSPLVVNSVFAGNTALYGGGLYNESAATKLINCSFSGNLAFAEGGAISTYGAVVPQITNSILWGNSSGIRNAGGSTPAVTYSIVQGGYAGTGNLNVDPLFILQPVPALGNTGDLRVQGCSPAVNAGSNAALSGGVTTDLASLPRVANIAIDMGAYERQSPATSVIIYVDATATGNNSGESWANAYNNIGSAITELNFCSPGTTIQVAAGTYTAPLNTTYNFDKLGAAILGGYPNGGGTRNPVANPVIVKGNVQVLKSVNIDGLRVQKQ